MENIKNILSEEYNNNQLRAEAAMLELNQLQKENEELKNIITDMLTISDLWLIKACGEEHKGEAMVLGGLYYRMKEVIETDKL